ncbi:hypothetical protein GQ55_8G246400 [Panicum hallii var. hallii]|uniref:Uncharacterized protein n=1 Tax=Panicum hallii var. hallii TaxID=1504633 RepID=A0A2T7CQV5_9POAL|nr:hypothetical protein GQ55_8G246400 [Panicum hallii var. hallii]
MFKVSHDWRGPLQLQAAVLFSQLVLLASWLTQMVKESCVRKYATQRSSTPGSDTTDLSAKLLLASKE